MTAEMLARIAHEAARAAHYDNNEVVEWSKESAETRKGATAVASAVLSSKYGRELIEAAFSEDDLPTRVIRGVLLAALPVVFEEEAETDDQRAERLALEKRNRIVSPRVTEREKPGEVVTL